MYSVHYEVYIRTRVLCMCALSRDIRDGSVRVRWWGEGVSLPRLVDEKYYVTYTTILRKSKRIPSVYYNIKIVRVHRIKKLFPNPRDNVNGTLFNFI